MSNIEDIKKKLGLVYRDVLELWEIILYGNNIVGEVDVVGEKAIRCFKYYDSGSDSIMILAKDGSIIRKEHVYILRLNEEHSLFLFEDDINIGSTLYFGWEKVTWNIKDIVERLKHKLGENIDNYTIDWEIIRDVGLVMRMESEDTMVGDEGILPYTDSFCLVTDGKWVIYSNSEEDIENKRVIHMRGRLLNDGIKFIISYFDGKGGEDKFEFSSISKANDGREDVLYRGRDGRVEHVKLYKLLEKYNLGICRIDKLLASLNR